ncbi:MAG: MFS transporter [Jatrophihabitantaceae bacterium]
MTDAPQRPALWTPLRHRRFAAYAFALIISSAGTYAATVALSFGVLEASGPASLALILLSREVPLVLLVLVGGVIADRASRRMVLCASSSVQAISQLAGAASLALDPGNVGILMICAAVNGGAAAFSRPATVGLVPELVPTPELQSANAVLGFAPRVIGIAGAAAGAGLVGAVGAPWALVFDSMTFVVAAILFLSLGTTSRPPAAERTHPFRDFAEGWAVVRRHAWIWGMILSFGMFQLAYFPALSVLGPEIARTEYGGASAWAVLLSAGLLGGLVGLGVASRIRPGRPLLTVCLVGIPNIVEIWALASGWPLATVAAFAFLGGIGLALGDTLWVTTLQQRVDRDKLSRVSSFDWLGSLALNPLGYAVVAPLAAGIGTRATLATASCVLALAAGLPLLSRQVRQLSAPSESSAAPG